MAWKICVSLCFTSKIVKQHLNFYDLELPPVAWLTGEFIVASWHRIAKLQEKLKSCGWKIITSPVHIIEGLGNKASFSRKTQSCLTWSGFSVDFLMLIFWPKRSQWWWCLWMARFWNNVARKELENWWTHEWMVLWFLEWFSWANSLQ